MTAYLIVGAVFYLGVAVAVGVVAHDHYGRSTGGWILLSLLISPALAAPVPDRCFVAKRHSTFRHQFPPSQSVRGSAPTAIAKWVLIPPVAPTAGSGGKLRHWSAPAAPAGHDPTSGNSPSVAPGQPARRHSSPMALGDPTPDHAIGLEKWIRYQRRLYPYGLIFLAGVTGLLAWVLFALIAMG